jgi:hypothetical protein
MTEIYTERKKTTAADWMEYSNLLVDKFAIHSSSFFHLSKGIIELKKSGEQVRMSGYDMFTVHTTFRAILETYITYNHIYVEPISDGEKELKFLLWKLDGYYQRLKFDIYVTDFDGAENVLNENQKEVELLINKIQNNQFFLTIRKGQESKIFDPSKKRANWKFTFRHKNLKLLKIIELIKHCCKERAFVNIYKYASIHTHSNYPAIEDFRRTRGIPLSNEKTDSLTRLAIYLTCLLIYDIASIDSNAKMKLDSLPLPLQNFINGMCISIKSDRIK